MPIPRHIGDRDGEPPAIARRSNAGERRTTSDARRAANGGHNCDRNGRERHHRRYADASMRTFVLNRSAAAWRSAEPHSRSTLPRRVGERRGLW